jgi:ubiquinone/menaquinone biosynthesis C-methylase UbiE
VTETAAKPAHLGPQYGAQFEDRSVVAAYRTRPPYPDGVFDVLAGLLAPGPARALELGCGSGDLTLGLAARVTRLDALEPSAAMLEIARPRAAAHGNITWIAQPAEAFEPRERYALVVAAESLHWMEWGVVLPRLARWLEPGASLAVVERSFSGLPFEREVGALIARFSTNRMFQKSDLIEELRSRRLFAERGRRRTRSVSFAQPVDDYVESFHSRNGFSRERMTAEAAAAFDRGVREAVLAHSPDGVVRGELSARIVWGAPGSE